MCSHVRACSWRMFLSLTLNSNHVKLPRQEDATHVAVAGDNSWSLLNYQVYRKWRKEEQKSLSLMYETKSPDEIYDVAVLKPLVWNSFCLFYLIFKIRYGVISSLCHCCIINHLSHIPCNIYLLIIPLQIFSLFCFKSATYFMLIIILFNVTFIIFNVEFVQICAFLN